ncbi:MAG: HEAT repeat domain-containing protein [Planctomycetes bacterium]|nr:HEAT repeat domain-containing protein [Planctomycetota bacterium]
MQLTRMGAEAKGSVSVLSSLIAEESLACRALGAIGPEARSAIGPLKKLLANPKADLGCRQAAAIALGRLAADPREVRPALRAALREGGWLSHGALEGLYWVGPEPSVLPELRRYMRHKRVRVRKAAVRVAARLCPKAPGPSLAILESALTDSNKQIRSEAARQLCYLGWHAVPALESLEKALVDSTLEVRQWAVFALAEAAAEGVPSLLRAAQGDDRAVRMLAMRSLGQMGPRGRRAVPLLARALVGADWYERRVAIEALGGLGKFAEPALGKLLGVARGTLGLKALDPGMSIGVAAPFEARIRLSALRAVERIGPQAAKLARPVLEALLAGKPSEQSAWAVWLHTKLTKDEPNLAFLNKCLMDPRAEVRAAAAEVAGRLGTTAIPCAAKLFRLGPVRKVTLGRERMWVAFALQRVTRDFDAIPHLRGGVLSRTPLVRRAALSALAALGTEGSLAAPEVFKAAVWHEMEAFPTLARLGPGADPALEYLIQTSLKGKPSASLAARRALKDLGQTIPALGLRGR